MVRRIALLLACLFVDPSHAQTLLRWFGPSTGILVGTANNPETRAALSTDFAAVSVPTFSGSITSGHCVQWLSSSNVGDAGAACSTSAAGSTNNIQINAGSGVFGAIANGTTGQVLNAGSPPSWGSLSALALPAFTGDCTSTAGTSALTCGFKPLSGTTGSIGGGALTAGTCATGTATVTGVTTSMAIEATPAATPGPGFYESPPYVSGTNTVTVSICAAVAGTPTATTYNVRAIP